MDCPPQLVDGVGPGLVINANLIQGNTAEGGSGGGLRLQHVDGTEVQRFPNTPANWYEVTVTNNIIANNVAGWGGGGVSLLDALKVNFTNNTVVSNDTTATAGVLFDTNVAPNANVPPVGCDPTLVPPPPACSNTSVTTSNFMVAGLQADLNSGQLTGVMTNAGVVCPNHPNCTKFSNPVLNNNLFWQNRSFHITTGAIPAPGLETAVQLVPAMQQTTTGACPSGATYWDIGVYGDTSATNHGSGYTLNPQFSMFSANQGYTTNGNIAPSSSGVVSQYCNGSRVPPEIASTLCTGGTNSQANAPGCIQPGQVGIGITVPPGITNSTYAGPAFSLTPAATVDEGSNWVNMFYGPLSMSNATIAKGVTGYGVPLGNYAPSTGSPAVGAVPVLIAHPPTDFFGNPRPDGGTPCFDIGAVEILGGADSCGGGGAPLAFAPSTRNFGSVTRGSLLGPHQVFTLRNTGSVPLTGITQATLGGLNPTEFSIVRLVSTCGPAGGGQLLGQTTLAPGAACVITVQFRPLTTQPLGAQAATVSVTDLAGTQTATLTGTAQ